MRVVISRKGFDAAAGGTASPILPSGEPASLPIPETRPTEESALYDDLPCGPYSMGKVVRDLLPSGRLPKLQAHLDPDLNPASRPRRRGWEAMFGQALAAERHLQQEGVVAGDLILFFGWFRQTEMHDGRLRYVKGAPDLHLIFGWLQIAERVPWEQTHVLPAWAADHPHCRARPYGKPDSIYRAAPALTVPGVPVGRAGAGLFKRVTSSRQLTAPGSSRSIWRLPRWFHPSVGDCCLTYHRQSERWQLGRDHALLKVVGRGQEFVLHNAPRGGLGEWLSEVFA